MTAGPVFAMAVAAAAIVMAPVRPVRHGIPGFPRVAAPATSAGRRINRALDRWDARVRVAAHDCLDEGGGNPTDWQRRIDVTMRGPEFLSYLVTDYVDCGGAHPSDAHSAIVYDLRTGAPVDWRALLPTRLTGRMALTQGEDGVKVVTLASRRLDALYRAGYDPTRTGDPQDCAGLSDTNDEAEAPMPMLAWLDARAGGLALQFDLSHAAQTCSQAVVLPIAVLRREGADPRLLAALATAHGRR